MSATLLVMLLIISSEINFSNDTLHVYDWMLKANRQGEPSHNFIVIMQLIVNRYLSVWLIMLSFMFKGLY